MLFKFFVLVFVKLVVAVISVDSSSIKVDLETTACVEIPVAVATVVVMRCKDFMLWTR